MSIKSIGITLLAGLLIFFLFTKVRVKNSPVKNTLKVTTSFYPLEFIAERIGGSYVTVTNLTPPGAEPHDFEPSTRDIVRLESQDVILLNGGGIEGYVDNVKKNIDTKKTSLIIVGQMLMKDPKDPHVWLDPILYIEEVKIITNAFIQKDPLHAKIYTENMKKLIYELIALDNEFKSGLKNCYQKDIITSHKAFSYLVNRYGLREVALAGLSPEQEPSSKALAEISTFAKENKINYIFFEALVNPAISDTIAREVGAQTLVLNPLEGLTNQEKKVKKTYVTIQKENLINLKIALECK